MTSLINIEQLSSTCGNLKEANEIPVKVSTTELNCAILESMPSIIKPKPQTSENTPQLAAVNQNKDMKTYECKECHKNFITVPYLQEHMKSHTNLFTCWICDETFSLMTQLTSHLTDCSKQQKSMHCTTCDKTFEFPALFKQHNIIYHPEGRPGEAFPKKQVLVQNMQLYLGDYVRESSEISKSKVCCPICQKEFSNSYYALRGHALLHAVSNFFCVVCHKEFRTSKIDFQIHMQQHVPENKPPFKCEHCSKEFGKRNRLWSHYRVVHPLKRVNVTTETDSSIAMVKKTVADNNILLESDTPICNRETSELIKETHAKRLTCPECEKVCQSKYSLLEHLLLHEIRDFICVVCHKKITTTKIDFKIHMQQHCTPDNRGRFNCEHCLKSYSQKKALISHYRVNHPPKRIVNDKEGSENCEQTQQIALVKSEPNESDFTITHNEIIMNEISEDDEDNDLLELEKAALYEKFCDEDELTELVSSMESEPSSPESPYINLEDDKMTVEETDMNTAITHNELIIIKEDNNLIDLEKSASYKEFDEENKLTELVSSMESEPSSPESPYINLEDDKITVEETDVNTETITHNELIIIKEDNNLIDLEKSASYNEFDEENKLTELVSSMESEPSSPESPYINLEDDKIKVEETDVNTETITHNEIKIRDEIKKTPEDNNLLELEKAACYKEFDEANKLTELVSLMKSEPSSPESSYVKLEDDNFIIEVTDVKTDAITHSEIIIKKTPEDNNLLELEKAAGNEKFCEENKLTELVSVMESEPSSTESPYFNLEHDKFIIEETNVKTDESKAELNNPLPALIGSRPVMNKSNDPCLVDVDQKQQKKFYVCHECHEIYKTASYLYNHFMKKHTYSLCWICGERFLIDQLDLHIEAHARYTCNICNKIFLRPSDLEIHNKMIHRSLQQDGSCHKQKNELTHRSQNRLHNKLFPCEICGKRFITERHLENHLKTHTENESARVSKQVVANETESGIGTVIRRKVKRRKIVKKREITLPSASDNNLLLQLSRVHSFAHQGIAKKAVFSGKLVKVNNAADEQKRLLVQLKLLKKPQKQHVPESNTKNRGDTVRYKEFSKQSEHNEIVDAELVDTAKYEPSTSESPYYVKSELEQLVDTAKCETYDAAQSPYHYVTTESKELVDMAKYEPSSSPESPYYYVKSELEELVDTAKFEKDATQSPHYYVKSELEELVDTAKCETYDAAQSPYHYVTSESKELVDTAKFEKDATQSPHYYVKSEVEELVDTAKCETYDAAQSPYYYVITESKELVDTAKLKLSSP